MKLSIQELFRFEWMLQQENLTLFLKGKCVKSKFYLQVFFCIMGISRDSRLHSRCAVLPLAPAHAFSVTVFTLNISSLKQWAKELCTLLAAPDASEYLRSAHFYLRQLQGLGWRGHPVEDGNFKPKKRKKKSAAKTIRKWKHKFWSIFSEHLERKIEVIWV